jgi:hypothetical protein
MGILGGFCVSGEGNELHHFVVVTLYFSLDGCDVFHGVQVVEIGELAGNGINVDPGRRGHRVCISIIVNTP